MSIVDQFGRPAESEYERSTDLTEIARIFQKQNSTQAYGKRAFRNVWIYSTVRSIVSSLADIPMGLWTPKRNKDTQFSTKTWVPVEHPVLSYKIDNPNPIQSKRRFIEQWGTFLLMGGNVWVYKDQIDSTGFPRSLLLFGADSVMPIRRTYNSPPESWQVQIPGGATVIVPLDQMIHWMIPNDYDQWMGCPPWLSMDAQLDADAARVIFDKFFFRNNATPDAVLTYKPGPLNKAARDTIYEAWHEAYAGPQRGGGLAVIGGDFDLKVLGVTHSAAQYLESRKFTRQEAASIYQYPVQLLNDNEHSGLSKDQLSVARMLKYENAVFPWASMLAEGLNEGYINKFLKGTKKISIYFDYDGLPVMMDYMDTKMNILKSMVSSGIPLNQAIAKLDLGIDPVDGGDVGLILNNYIPIELMEDAAETGELPQITSPSSGSGLAAKTDLTPEKEGSKDAKESADEEDAKDGEGRSIILFSDAKRWTSLIKDVKPLVERATRKIKRILFDTRNECFRNSETDEVFDLVATSEKWRRSIRPILVAAMQLGSDKYNHRETWTKITKDIDSVLSFLQKEIRGTQNIQLLSQLESHEGRFIEVLSILRKEIEQAPLENREQQIRLSFNKLYDVAYTLGTEEIIWAMNLGARNSMNGNTSYMAVSTTSHCRVKNHFSYPGDGALKFADVHGCHCIIVPEEK
jgi:HK97 family phage portal protein